MARLVEVMGYKPRHLRMVIKRSLNALLDQGLFEEVTAYVSRIPEVHAKRIRTDSFIRTAKLKGDIDGFVQSLTTADVDEGKERRNWLVDPKSLMGIFESADGLGRSLFFSDL